ncbi:hypothetical protein BVC80_4145g1 [Macleaya cordata]|uniref:Reverse transcriptase zinc-binding domain n=1 Tax=Macleaya cordata TaxID=56857 RepID=A0A200PYP0_MACCD|nr:hypothetical protein BVC80_4145g1 [Macleaya cordata]
MADGTKVRFWKDQWIGQAPFCKKFPASYAESIAKQFIVAQMNMGTNQEEGAWNLNFSQRLYENEVSDMLLILNDF